MPKVSIEIVSNWRRILQRAWSVRLIVLAGLLSGVEAALPLFPREIPVGIFTALSILVTAAALVSRFVAQKNLPELT